MFFLRISKPAGGLLNAVLVQELIEISEVHCLIDQPTQTVFLQGYLGCQVTNGQSWLGVQTLLAHRRQNAIDQLLIMS